MTMPVNRSAVLNAAMNPPRAVGTLISSVPPPAAADRSRDSVSIGRPAGAGLPLPEPCHPRSGRGPSPPLSAATRRTSRGGRAVDAPLEGLVDKRDRQPQPLLISVAQGLVERPGCGPVDDDPGEDQHDDHDRRQQRGEANCQGPPAITASGPGRRQAIAGGRHGLDQPRRARDRRPACAAGSRRDVDHALEHLVRAAGNDVEELLPAQDRAGPRRKRGEQRRLAGRQPPAAPIGQRVAARARIEQEPTSVEAEDRRRLVGDAARVRRRIAATRAVSSCGLNGLAR